MTIPKNELGRIGENLAVEFLKGQGYQIIRQNFQNKIGEIDIIARDQDELCFIEVKMKSSDDFGSPFEMVTARKQRKIAQVAASYLQNEHMDDVNARFDVVGINMQEPYDKKIEVIKNAFEVS